MRFPCHQSLFFSLKVRLILIALISVPLLFCLNTIGLFLGSETLRVWELDLPNRKIRPTDCNTGKLRRIVKCIAVWACSTSLQIWGPHEFCTMSPMWPCYQKKVKKHERIDWKWMHLQKGLQRNDITQWHIEMDPSWHAVLCKNYESSLTFFLTLPLNLKMGAVIYGKNAVFKRQKQGLYNSTELQSQCRLKYEHLFNFSTETLLDKLFL